MDQSVNPKLNVDQSLMTSWLRRAVSQQKRRLTDSEYDLDLSYIVLDPQRGNVIAMGVPVSGTAGRPRPLPSHDVHETNVVSCTPHRAHVELQARCRSHQDVLCLRMLCSGAQQTA